MMFAIDMLTAPRQAHTVRLIPHKAIELNRDPRFLSPKARYLKPHEPYFN